MLASVEGRQPQSLHAECAAKITAPDRRGLQKKMDDRDLDMKGARGKRHPGGLQPSMLASTQPADAEAEAATERDRGRQRRTRRV